MITVALIGPDGAGKSTVSKRLVSESSALPAPVKSIYMGVNLEASGLMLPTTRLILRLQRARGLEPDNGPPPPADDDPRRPSGLAGRMVASTKSGVRLLAWIGEEWFRQLVASYHKLRGTIVVFDRHFFVDYYHYDIARSTATRTLSSRIHGFLLRRVYPKPDLVICLDAPGEVLFARKGEGTLEALDRRRHDYLQIAEVVPTFAVVDATQPEEDVFRDVVDLIRSHCPVRRR